MSFIINAAQCLLPFMKPLDLRSDTARSRMAMVYTCMVSVNAADHGGMQMVRMVAVKHARPRQNLYFSMELLMRSTMTVLSSGIYWLVTSLIASCATMPPRKAAVVGSVEKPPRVLRFSVMMSRRRIQARVRAYVSAIA